MRNPRLAKATGYPAACALALLEQLFLYLGDTKPPDFFYTDMGHCRNFIGVDHSVENRWSGRCQKRANRLCQLRRMTNGETLRSACACEGGEVHIREAGARCGRHPRTLHFELHEAPAGVVVDDDLDWQPVLDARHELAEQHREAAVAGLQNDLPVAVQRLCPVGDAAAGADRSIVERPQDALTAGLSQPVTNQFISSFTLVV